MENIPPDPGEAGKVTLLGIDANNNGIRDDVERHVVLDNADKPEIIPPLLHYAILTQDALRRHSWGESQPESYLDRAILNLGCVDYIDPEQGFDRLLAMMDVITNMPKRRLAKLKIDKAVAGGKGVSFAAVTEKECQEMLEDMHKDSSANPR